LREQARFWTELAKFERAGARLPGQKGIRYQREAWKFLYYALVVGAPGMTGFMRAEPDAAQKIAEHFDRALAKGEPTSEWRAVAAFNRVELRHPSPFGREEAVAYVASQTGQTPRGAWEMLRRVGTENLPTRPR